LLRLGALPAYEIKSQLLSGESTVSGRYLVPKSLNHRPHIGLIRPVTLSAASELPMILTFKRFEQICSTVITILLPLAFVSCKGQDFGVLQPTPKDLCKCLAIEPDIADYRHLAKHVPIPNVAAQEVTVAIILTWPEDPIIPPDAPRTGRELEVFHIADAFLQNASVNAVDCDVVMEISQTADKSSPRMIVETPVDSEYCSARQNLQAQLKQHGFRLDSQHGGELSQALPVDVIGLAFEDFDHNRGAVATLWELHPAIVTLH
jgi:hypothetical protein